VYLRGSWCDLISLYHSVSILPQVFCEALAVTLGKQVWIAIVITPVALFCWIRNLESLSPFSLVANLCILLSLAVIFYEEIYSFL
jgi:amino acid permease